MATRNPQSLRKGPNDGHCKKGDVKSAHRGPFPMLLIWRSCHRPRACSSPIWPVVYKPLPLPSDAFPSFSHDLGVFIPFQRRLCRWQCRFCLVSSGDELDPERRTGPDSNMVRWMGSRQLFWVGRPRRTPLRRHISVCLPGGLPGWWPCYKMARWRPPFWTWCCSVPCVYLPQQSQLHRQSNNRQP